MTELGNRLKEARIEKGFSLDDLQTMTKIQKRYLISIEEGNYSSMPGNFYVRAFIKQYAEALNLNPDEIFETYKSEIPASLNDEIPQLSRVKTHKAISEGNSKIFDILPKVLIGVFVIGVAGLLYYFLYNYAGKDSNESLSKDNEQVKFVKSENLEKAKANELEKKDSEKVKETKKEEEKTPVVEAPKQEITVVQSQGRNSTYSLKNAEKFIVKLVATGKSWVGVKNSTGKMVNQWTLDKDKLPSQTVDLTAESNAVIRVGNAAGVEIYVNDQKLEYAIAPTQNVQNITIQYVPKTQ
ncbi:helix-turn-helix domain-containing protein [Neobacillus bataviensis]|uniref:helix-turn-helix domain-containing protein n=1 Tax=Neobacillus bataviensis TaxID=220685 RepID=UPI001CBBE038|nr:RodZ domain-containing protein [Neobacillus bataviensis]